MGPLYAQILCLLAFHNLSVLKKGCDARLEVHASKAYPSSKEFRGLVFAILYQISDDRPCDYKTLLQFCHTYHLPQNKCSPCFLGCYERYDMASSFKLNKQSPRILNCHLVAF